MSILIVDDSDSFRAEVYSKLKQQGFTYISTADGEKKALEIIKNKQFALVITDTQMERSDSGKYLCKVIKQQYPQTKVILMSADKNLLGEAQMEGIPADAFFSKRVGLQMLIKQITELGFSPIGL